MENDFVLGCMTRFSWTLTQFYAQDQVELRRRLNLEAVAGS